MLVTVLTSHTLGNKKRMLTATTDLGNWLNGKWFCIWDDLSNPKDTILKSV
jgi:hypothetical protein